MRRAPVLATCPRCGLRRPVHHRPGPDILCASCKKVEPAWPNVHIPTTRAVPRYRESDAVARALLSIATAIGDAAQKATAVCPCGCLNLLGEACPNCEVTMPRKKSA